MKQQLQFTLFSCMISYLNVLFSCFLNKQIISKKDVEIKIEQDDLLIWQVIYDNSELIVLGCVILYNGLKYVNIPNYMIMWHKFS